MWHNRFLNRTKICLLCHARFDWIDESVLCSGCLKDIRTLYRAPSERCPTCAKFSIDGSICGKCQNARPPLEKFWASAIYAAPIPVLLHEFKHLCHLHYGKVLSQIMLDNPPTWLTESQIDCVLAMPISHERRIYRGFNQCDELANIITSHYTIPLLPHNYVFRTPKPPQSTLEATERTKNVRGSFRVDFNVKNRKVLIIDDVSTTGSSIFELARTLRKSGAAAIYAWVVARNL